METVNMRRNVLAVAVLAFLAFTSPNVNDAIMAGASINGGYQVAAVAAVPSTGTVNGTPVLGITYDSNKKESSIMAAFAVTVNGGTLGTNIYKNSAPMHLVNQNGVSTWVGYSAVVSPSSSLTTGTDGSGQTYFVVAPGQVVNFTVTVNINPIQIILGGSYYAVLDGLTVNPYSITEALQRLPVSANKSNAVVVVGETSPYVSQITSGVYLIPGNKVTVSGLRLQNVSLSIDGVRQTNASVNTSNNGTQVTFVLPKTLALGNHYFTLDNGQGVGNRVGFIAVSAAQIVIAYTSPGSGAPGDVITISGFGFTSSGFVKWSGPATSIASSLASISTDGTKATTVIPSGIPAGTYNVTVANGMSVSNIVSFSVAQIPTPIIPTITVNSPNGGESYAPLDAINFSATTNYPAKQLVAFLYSSVNGNVVTLYPSSSGTAGDIKGSFSGDPSIAAGQYKITVCDLMTDSSVTPGKPLCDSSDNYFKVVAATSTTPSVTVLSPNGGERYVIGSVVPIKWTSTNIQSKYVYLGLIGPTGTNLSQVEPQATNNGLFNWIIGSGLQPGQYKITVTDPNNNSTTDASDSSFAITAIPAIISATIDASSPVSSIVQVSPSVDTDNVLLAAFSLKSASTDSTLRQLKLNINSSVSPISNLFSDIKIRINGVTHFADSISVTTNPPVATFSNLSVRLPADQYVTIQVVAKVKANGTGNATVSLDANSNTVYAEDANLNQVLSIQPTLVSGNQISFTASGVIATSASVSYGTKTVQNSGITTQSLTFSVSITAAGNPIFVSNNVATALTTTNSNSAVTINNVSWSDNDGSNPFYIAPGQTKTFSATYTAAAASSAVSTVFRVSSINVGTTSSGTGIALNSSDIQNALTAVLFH